MRSWGMSLALLVVFSMPAEARPRVNNLKVAQAEARKITRAQRALKARVAKLSAFDRRTFKAKAFGADTDGDGVSDLVEGAIGSNSCMTDSDSDGFDDGSDSREGTPGTDDGENEFEVKGAVVSFTDSVIVIGSTSYTVSGETRFVGRGFSREDLVPGVCIKVVGLETQGEQKVRKVEVEDGCSDD